MNWKRALLGMVILSSFYLFFGTCSLGNVDMLRPSFTDLMADGSEIATTTKLTLYFNKDIEGLTKNDIVLDIGDTGMIRGTLTKTKTGIYELTIAGINSSGDVKVAVDKSGYNSGFKKVTVYHYIAPTDITVAFINLEANGSATETTTKLILTFDREIDDLAKNDIFLDAGSIGAVKDTLTSIGTGIYELTVGGITSGGIVTMAVSKSGYNITGNKMATVYHYNAPTNTAASFTNLTANGSATATTTKLILTFDKDITGLSAADITLDAGSTGASKGTLTRTGTGVYELALSGITSGGSVTIAVSKAGYNFSGGPRTVTVYHYYVAPPPDTAASFTNLAANGSATATTTKLTLTFDKDITGLSATDITLNAGSTGAVKGALSKTGTGVYELALSGITSGGSVTVAVSKTGYSISGGPKTVTVYHYTTAPITDTAASFTNLAANGSATVTTTKLTLTFDKDITGLSAADIILDAGSTGAVKGALSRTGTGVYDLALSGITSGGSVTVAVSKTGYAISGGPRTVTVYYYYVAPPQDITVAFTDLKADGSTTLTTTKLTLTFDKDIAGLGAGDISLTGSTGAKGTTLTRTGTGIYDLALNGITSGGDVTVLSVSKSGYNITGWPKSVVVFHYVPVTGITLNKSTLALDVGATETLIATVLPTNATNKNVTWSGGNAFASVSQSGLVTALVTGNATIKVTTVDGGFPAECDVTVSVGTLIPADLAAYLAGLSTNTANPPYNIKLNVSNASEFSTIRSALNGNGGSRKYVYLDLSGSAVIAIPDNAFRGTSSPYGCTTLKGITISDKVTSIGDSAFDRCDNLASVIIPNSVISIGNAAFTSCGNLTSVTIPNNSGFTSIGRNVFYNCTSLSSITIPNSVTSIGENAFAGCSLTSITIPDSVNNIDNSAFRSCSSLTTINVGSGNNAYAAENGVLYSKDKKTLVAYPSANGSYAIPSGVTSIGSSAFYHCSSLASVNIPDGVTSIGEYAFYYCSSLASVNIPSGVTSIGGSAFYRCSKLTSINIPNSVISIEGGAFTGCTSLSNITLSNNITTILAVTFYQCSSLASVTIPNSIISIETGAFRSCNNLTSVTFQGTIPSSGFYNGTELPAFDGDLRTKFYATDKTNGTPGTYTTTAPVGSSSVWTKQ